MWENFVFIERMKKSFNQGEHKKYYFWRTNETAAKEYDMIEEENGVLKVFEIKWGANRASKVKKYPIFFDSYPGSELNVISRENFVDYLVETCYIAYQY